MYPSITVTEAAKNYIKKMLEKNAGGVFRLSIKKTGCSGFSYLPLILEKEEATDMSVEVASDLKIFIDTAWLSLLEGVQMDYIEEEKSGLKQKRLVFSNPKEDSRCGCGESFHVRG